MVNLCVYLMIFVFFQMCFGYGQARVVQQASSKLKLRCTTKDVIIVIIYKRTFYWA
jgi:hypothetical protein